MPVMDRNAAYRQAKSEFETAKAALDDLKVQLGDIPGYPYLQVLRRVKRETEKELKRLFEQAGVLTDSQNFEFCLENWWKLLPEGGAKQAVGQMMDRLTGIKVQTSATISKGDWPRIKSLEADLAKARRAHDEAFRLYQPMAVEKRRQWEERQVRLAVDEAAAPVVVSHVLAGLNHPSRNRGRGRRRQKGAGKIMKIARSPKEKGTKAERKRAAMMTAQSGE